jgi:acetyl esterase/lipase
MTARKFALSALLLALGTLSAATATLAQDQQVIYLWPGGAPGSESKIAPEAVRTTSDGEHVYSSIHRPSVRPYLPAKESATGAAVLVIPGGGHAEIWAEHEGATVASWLSAHGVAAFVLKYRLAREKRSTYTIDGNEVPDAERAIRLIRHSAAEWNVDPNRIGVMGFSAGGQLTVLAATRFDAGNPQASDPIDRESSRPNFQAPIYPGPLPDVNVDLANLPKDTPQAFLLCGDQDSMKIAAGLAEYYAALKRSGIPAELHIYAGIGHGFGVRPSNTGPIAGWTDRFLEWLNARGLLQHN